MKQVLLAATAAVAVGFVTAAPAKADVQMTERGGVAYLTSHRLKPGDAREVRSFLSSPHAQPIRIVYMNSLGGNERVAMRIGRMIREQGIDTGFDPRHGRCVSSCTVMYLGGVHRYYVGGSRVRDGVETKYGMGFHPPKRSRPGGEEEMAAYYQEMGAPGAAALRYRVSPRESLDQPFEGVGPRGRRPLAFVGSRTALQAGVATGTAPPPGLNY